MGEYDTVSSTKECSAISKDQIPPKAKEPDTISIPIYIGGKELFRALCDLGASINLMPLFVYQKLGRGEARLTTITLQLAHRSTTFPEGKLECISVRVDKYFFHFGP